MRRLGFHFSEYFKCFFSVNRSVVDFTKEKIVLTVLELSAVFFFLGSSEQNDGLNERCDFNACTNINRNIVYVVPVT